jgi:hypothetical protein
MARAVNPQGDLAAIGNQQLLDVHALDLALTLSLSDGERSRFDKLNVSALEQGFSH